MDLGEAAQTFREFVAIVQALRTPGTGCPWDLEQDHRTLRPFLIEEAYEVLDAIDGGDDRALCEELGDLLLQVVLHAQVADDRGAFAITEVVRGIADKMVRRHPHVFGTVQVSGSEEVLHNWEQIKAAEAQNKGATSNSGNPLGRLPQGLPALQRAQRLGDKAAKVQAEGTTLLNVLAQMHDHYATLAAEVRALAVSRPSAEDTPAAMARALTVDLRWRLEQELGALLFSLCQLARWLGVSAEDSLRAYAWRFVADFESLKRQVPGETRA